MSVSYYSCLLFYVLEFSHDVDEEEDIPRRRRYNSYDLTRTAVTAMPLPGNSSHSNYIVFAEGKNNSFEDTVVIHRKSSIEVRAVIDTHIHCLIIICYE